MAKAKEGLVLVVITACIVVGVTQVIAHYLYQFLRDKDWKTAFERSYFEINAVALVALVASLFVLLL